ncbi:MAG: PAS domain S-box protein [Candidatus Krumholzibacteriia bacterium]
MDMDARLLSQVLEGLPDGVSIQDREFRILYQNAAIRSAFGSHLGEHCYQVYEGRDRKCEGCGLEAAFASGRPAVVIRRVTGIGNQESVWENACSPLFDQEGRIVGGVESCRNITQRSELEAQLNARTRELTRLNHEYLTLLANLPDFIVRYDRNLERVYVNPAWERAAGSTPNQAGAGPVAGVPRTTLPIVPEYAKRLRLAFAEGRAQNCEFEWVNAAGGKRFLSYRLIPEFDGKGEVASVLSVGLDLTARKEAEDALQEQQRRAQSLLRLSRRLEAAEGYPEVLAAASDEVREITGFNNLWVYLFSEDRQYADVLMAEGPQSACILGEASVARLTIAGDPMLEEIADSTDPVLVVDATTDPRTDKEIVAKLGNRTIINVPILVSERHFGSVGIGTFGDEGVRVPSKADLDYLTSVASHLAATLDRIQLMEQRRLAESSLRDLNRKLKAISECNQVLVRARDERDLLAEVCRIVCEEAGYLLAWVGYVEHDSEKTLRPVAWAGDDSDYISQAKVTWAEDDPRGRGPAGIAVRTGRTVDVRDIATDERMKPWREGALGRGYRSGLALPLKALDDTVFGVLLVYFGEPDVTSPDEIHLMEELALDLAFGISVLRDREEQERTERQVHLLGFALDSVEEAAFLIDEKAAFTYVNNEACRSLGYSRSELLGMRVFDIDPDFTEDRWAPTIEALKNSGLVVFETRHRTKDGRVFPVEIQSSYFVFEGEGFNLALARDITERRQVEEERRSNLRFFEAMDQVNVAIQKAGDLDGMMVAVLDSVLAIFQCDRASLIYPCDPESPTWRVPMERNRPEFPGVFSEGLEMPMTPEVAAMHRISLDTGRPVVFGAESDFPLPEEVRKFGDKTGMGMAIFPKESLAWGFSVTQCSHPRTWTEEEIRLFEAIGRRIADGLTGLLSYRNLVEHREFLDNIIENIPSMLFVKDAETLAFVRFNRAGEKLLGIPRQELLGRTDHDLFPEDIADAFTRKDREVLESLEPRDIPEERIRIRSGEERVLHTQKIPLTDGRGEPRYLLGISEDITEGVLARSEVQKLTQAIEQSPVSILVTDSEGRIEFVNQMHARVTGYSKSEVLGRNPRMFKSGETPAEVYRDLWRTIGSGETWSGELHNRKKNGELFLERATIAPLRGSGQVITHFIAVKEDITERRRLEDQLRQSQKLESVGHLAGGVAHDFNNMLAIIMGNAELALTLIPSNLPSSHLLREIIKASENAGELTRQLLTFARKQVISPRLIDLDQSVEGMLGMLGRLLGENIELTWRPGGGGLTVKLDPTQLNQILVNLCVNARDAMDGGGRISIGTRRVVIGSGECRAGSDSRPGTYAALVVGDNGRGMDKGTLERIFEPFFTTKGIGRGTGLGLATVYGIVKQNGGFIHASSEVGRGTSFSVHLPLLEKGAADHLPEHQIKAGVRGTETVLVVEDNPAILEMIRRMLEDCGYRVMQAESPARAIDLVVSRKERIDLMITDVIMPGMNGKELSEEIRRHCPGIDCLFMSGYSPDVISRQGILDEGIHFIQKPFTLEGLTSTVRSVLDDRSES